MMDAGDILQNIFDAEKLSGVRMNFVSMHPRTLSLLFKEKYPGDLAKMVYVLQKALDRHVELREDIPEDKVVATHERLKAAARAG